MSTLQDLWNGYWWVLPVGLMLLCVLGCILGGRKGRTGSWPCRPWSRTRRTRCC
jgi:hypothetical protein